MLYYPTYKVTIGEFAFGRTNPEVTGGAMINLSVYSSGVSEPDEAIIALPYATIKTAEGKEVGMVDISTFEEGDPVSVSLGMHGYEVSPVFVGEIDRIEPGSPVTLNCKDASKELVRSTVNKTYRDITADNIEAVINELAPGFETVVNVPPGITRNQYRCDNWTSFYALEKLAEELGLAFYIAPGEKTVYFGYPLGEYDARGDEDEVVPVFEYGLNILKTVSLEYRSESPVGQCIVFGMSNSDYMVEGKYPATPKEGPIRERHLPDISDAGHCAEEAERWYYELASSRWRGSFTTIGRSDVRHSMRCLMRDPAQSARNLHAWIGSVTYNFGAAFTMDVSLTAEA